MLGRSAVLLIVERVGMRVGVGRGRRARGLFVLCRKRQIDVLFGVVIIREGRGGLVEFSGLRLASVALLPERKVEIAAVQANPIPLSALRGGPRALLAALRLLDRCKIVHI